MYSVFLNIIDVINNEMVNKFSFGPLILLKLGFFLNSAKVKLGTTNSNGGSNEN